MKNDYEVRGDIVVIFLKRKDGTRLECLIDREDLEKAKSFPNAWQCGWSPGGRTFYVRGNTRRNGKPNSIIFHRYLLDAPKGMHVDHINHNTLDNRRSNLRVVTPTQNGQNKKGSNKNSKSGVRNVVWREDVQKWCIYININRKTRNLGFYKSLEEAERVASEARTTLMPYSKDAMKKEGVQVGD
jgi:hypothetical protein